MSKKASPVAIGGFVVGITGLTVALAFFFGGGDLFSDTKKYELVYKTSIKGLNVGAPVTIKGVKIGEVLSIKARMYPDKVDILTSAVIEINRDVIERVGDYGSAEEERELGEDLLRKGLAAQLKLQSLLTGLLYVDVDFHGDERPRTIDIETKYEQFPTVPTDMQEISKSLQNIDFAEISKNIKEIFEGLDSLINNNEVQDLSKSANDALVSIKKLADHVDSEIAVMRTDIEPITQEARVFMKTLNTELPDILESLEQSLASLESATKELGSATEEVEFLLSDDSPVLYELNKAARDMQRASRAVEILSESIERQPEAEPEIPSEKYQGL